MLGIPLTRIHAMTSADASDLHATHVRALPSLPAQAFWRDSAMPFVESRRACHSRACYKPHHHPTFSIGAVDAGFSVFTGAAEGPVTLTPGTLVFVPAARVHACNPAPGMAWSYQMLHLEAAWLQNIRQQHAQSEPVHIVTDPALYARFCQLNAMLFSDADQHDKEAALIAFIDDSDSHRGLCISTSPPAPQLVARMLPVLEWLRNECDATMTLDALAHRVDMNRYQLIRAFRAVTGLTPHAWQLNQRITLARAWLQRGDSLAAVAQQLGFADQAHFQRVFKAYTGVTPGQFRAD